MPWSVCRSYAASDPGPPERRIVRYAVPSCTSWTAGSFARCAIFPLEASTLTRNLPPSGPCSKPSCSARSARPFRIRMEPGSFIIGAIATGGRSTSSPFVPRRTLSALRSRRPLPSARTFQASQMVRDAGAWADAADDRHRHLSRGHGGFLRASHGCPPLAVLLGELGRLRTAAQERFRQSRENGPGLSPRRTVPASGWCSRRPGTPDRPGCAGAAGSPS